MKRPTIAILSLLVLLCLSFNQALACTTFCLKKNGEVLFGKNYDWMVGEGLVFVNKRGVAKESNAEDRANPARWVSKFGSVTFNQYGRENPSGGMNEAGLVIELMWLDETRYPTADTRPTVGTLEWIQYQLDTSATVAEVIANSGKIRISSLVPLHYLVNDKAGNTATIEFLNGHLVAHRGETLPFAALANDTYAKSLDYSKTTSVEKARTKSSLDRFVRASQKTAEFDKKTQSETEAISYAFEVLSSVAQEGSTQWSIVYDQKRGRIHWRTLQAPHIKTIDTKAFEYSCGTAVKLFNMNAKDSGDVTAKFVDYTQKANRDLIERAFNGTDFLKLMPAVIRDQLASYPEQFGCSLQPSRPAAAAAADWRHTVLALAAPILITMLM